MLDLLLRPLRRLPGDERGNVAIAVALSLPVVISAFGLGAEAASWMTSKRALQNAADAAAIAAATNAGSNYDLEAKGVAGQYGFKDGVDGVVVKASNTATCPTGGATCYSVTISREVPLMLAQVAGYKGDTTVNGAPAKTLSATAVATQGEGNRAYCVLALDSSGTSPGLRTNGAPKGQLTGCSVMSNGDADCNGHDLGADFGDAHGTNSGCGIKRRSNVPTVKDPYASAVSNIPPNPCSSYHFAGNKKKDPPLPGTNTAAGTLAASPAPICGDFQLTGDVTVNQDTVLYIYNGDLDTNGYTLKTAPGVGLTVVFTGTASSSSYSHVPTGDGTIDIAAPTSGPWSGMAMYQDPRLGSGSGVDVTAAGNSPTWDISGVVYLPHSSVTFSGAVNKSSNGKSCFGLVVDNLLINGTGSILAQGECEQAGVTLPTGKVISRGKLVS